MSVAFRMFPYFAFRRCLNRKHFSLTGTMVYRHLCVMNLTGDTKSAGEVNQACENRYNTSSLDFQERWSGENNEKIFRVFQRLKYIRLIKAAVRVGAPYPEQNPHLASLFEEMKKQDITVPTEQVIKLALNPKARTGIYEVAGPSGSLFVLQYESGSYTITEQVLKEVCMNYNYTFLGFQTQRLLVYHQKGILIAKSSECGTPLKEALETANKAGAESVSTMQDINGRAYIEVHCDPSDLHQVKRQLESSLTIEEAFIGYIPKSPVKVPDAIKAKIADAIVDFTNNPEVDMVYINIK